MGDSDEEDHCQYGTPLDPYDEDEVPKKKSAFQDITEQYALDAQGRRRFHGAFTGGFSAGHWNTVGLPEGWAPQSFKSSRSDRMKLMQKPEDFMDDEDRNEFGIAPKQVHTTKDFSGTKRPKQKQFHDGPIPGEPVLHSLLEPVHETVAISILKSMGWKPGHGIGEKITRKEKKAARKLYTCHIPAEYRSTEENAESHQDSEDSCDDETFSKILFEPDDFEPYVAKPKVDSFGLGYKGLSRHSILGTYVNPLGRDPNESHGSRFVTSDKGKKVSIRGQAFGVGALEEEDDDIYAKDDLSGYDFALDVSNKTKEKPDKKKAIAASTKNILDGFIVSTVSLIPRKVYPPPALPQGYVPPSGKVRKTRFDSIESTSQEQIVKPRDQALGRHDLTAKQRGSILGEFENKKIENKPNEPIKAPSSQSYAEKIAAITGRNINFVSKSDTTSKDSPDTAEKLEKDVSTVDSTAKVVENSTKSLMNDLQMSSVFRPFAANPAKQERYEKFIAVKEGTSKSDESNKQSNDNIENWEKDREQAEFEQAYKLYRPLTGIMKEKFISAKHQEDLNNPVVVSKDKDYYMHASSERQEAARLGMFGKMTRDTVEWKPESLLCKRFNVPEPQNGGYASQSSDKKKVSYSIFEYLETPVHNKNSYLKEHNALKANDINRYSKTVEPNSNKPKEVPATKESSTPINNKQKRMTVADLFLQEKEKELEVVAASKEKTTLAFQKELDKPSTSESVDVKETIDNFNKIDLYKAIFLSGSESENEDEPSKVEIEKPAIDFTPKNVERNPSPAKGIFANLNFDRMNSWRNTNIKFNKPKEKEKEKSIDETVIIAKNGSVDVEMVDTYGPKLPERLTKAVQNPIVVEDESSSDSSDWVETGNDEKKSKHKSKKSSKKKKKSKSSKHKHKKKKRK